MILATHALSGAVIGKNIGNPWIIILVSLVIHYSLDSFRHAEYFDNRTATIKNTWWKVAIDLTIGFFIIFSFFHLEKSNFMEIRNISIGVFFSLLPDLLTVIHWTFPRQKTLSKIKAFHAWIHRYSKFPKYSPERQWTFRNARNDIIISIIAIILLFL